ncbi:MAG TPA: bifunctional pyr operon transcriptional regulator/uracil phosphoribosyltransferase PyrR [Candidatus Omnitrophota bacterium]|nr:bifunctional pyr operon transcriptional regulator/uracil phosphoribosyltransferase PyrR [Candidatus Omnitrophota bacterium]HPS21033.1 bifunctional pyr operon transcriptional regulator/uracil phosphoribosyltransferase PyrR [Candidatus Omnitrophota bacterium]
MKSNKTEILDKEGMDRVIKRMAHEIVEQNRGVENLAIIGIKTRGAYIAGRLASKLKEIEKQTIPVGALDITLYRDDLTEIAAQPTVHATEIDFDITGKNIILVDDVLFTGRTVRCALDELVDFGRPAKIKLAVLIDRGHRELPIRPDYVGKNIPTARKDRIEVKLKELDGNEEVMMIQEDQEKAKK